MKKIAGVTSLILMAAMMPSTPAIAAAAWVDDTLRVPMRSGPSSRHSILHRGLISGTRLEVLSTDEEAGFAHIRLEDGRDGYIPTQYLSKIPIARDRLEEAQKTIEALTSESKPQQAQIFELREARKSLEQQVATLSGEKERIGQRLAEIENISKNAIATSKKNKTLMAENEAHKNSIDVLKADNERLKQNAEQEGFVNGAGAVLLGVVLALVIPRLTPKKKSSEWA